MCNEMMWINNVHEFLKYLRNEIFKNDLLTKTVAAIWILIGLTIVVIFFYLFLKNKRNQRKIFVQKKFNNFLGAIAVCESENELSETYFQRAYQKMLTRFLYNHFDRNVLIDELAETSKKFRGATMENIRWLFAKMNLKEELLKNLHSKKWHKKSKAIQQLSALQQKDCIDEIFELTNHENQLVRREAQIAMVNLTGFRGLQFLDKATYIISDWQQLRLIQELAVYPSNEFENVSVWMKSKNESVVSFALKLIEIYRLYDHYSEVEKCLSHSPIRLCQQAIITLGQICNETTADVLIAHYDKYNFQLQLRIIRVIQEIGNEEQIPFLLSIINAEEDLIKLEAAKAIARISPAAIENIRDLVNEFRSPWDVILPQIKMEFENENC